jgi:hypothetical protein
MKIRLHIATVKSGEIPLHGGGKVVTKKDVKEGAYLKQVEIGSDVAW